MLFSSLTMREFNFQINFTLLLLVVVSSNVLQNEKAEIAHYNTITRLLEVRSKDSKPGTDFSVPFEEEWAITAYEWCSYSYNIHRKSCTISGTISCNVPQCCQKIKCLELFEKRSKYSLGCTSLLLGAYPKFRNGSYGGQISQLERSMKTDVECGKVKNCSKLKPCGEKTKDEGWQLEVIETKTDQDILVNYTQVTEVAEYTYLYAYLVGEYCLEFYEENVLVSSSLWHTCCAINAVLTFVMAKNETMKLCKATIIQPFPRVSVQSPMRKTLIESMRALQELRLCDRRKDKCPPLPSNSSVCGDGFVTTSSSQQLQVRNFELTTHPPAETGGKMAVSAAIVRDAELNLAHSSRTAFIRHLVTPLVGLVNIHLFI